ncbi:MAG: hypothetical protein IT269_12005, partial [Saprospiraceae bacterium]|nr:hypothetical protein [Saprospiraceae bacterium]
MKFTFTLSAFEGLKTNLFWTILFVLAIPIFGFAQPMEFQTQNTFFQGMDKKGNTAVAAGQYGVLRYSTDGGFTWLGAKSPVASTYAAVSLANSTVGWAVGSGGVIVKTTDGGATWAVQNSGVTITLNDVHAVDANVAYACGGGGTTAANISTLLKTTNGGATWTPVWNASTIPAGLQGFNSSGTTLYYATLYATHFISEMEGYVVGGLTSSVPVANGSGSKIAKTTDGGATWSVITPVTGGNNFRCVNFVDANNGWAAGFNGSIYNTSNAGANWNPVTSGTTLILNGIHVVSPTTVVIGTGASTKGIVRKTLDGGATWTADTLNQQIGVLGPVVFDGGVGLVGGSVGMIYSTPNTTSNWMLRSGGSALNVNDMHFIDNNTGWYGADGGQVFRTVNAGSAWTNSNTGLTGAITGVYFTSASNGFAVSSNSVAGPVGSRSSDGGATWAVVPMGTGNTNLFDVYFPSASTGWTVGAGGAVNKTTDGGNSWINQVSGSSASLQAVHFVDENTGWISGGASTILKTTNGGTTWAPQTAPAGWPSTFIYDIWFADANIGYLCGASGRAAKTTDGGATWTALTTGTTFFLNDLEFISATEGFLFGSNGTILYTKDSGATFTEVTSKLTYALGTCVEIAPPYNCLSNIYFGYSATPIPGGTLVKSNFSSFFADDDLDGYGGTRAVCAYISGAGFSANSLDCNDANGAVNPGATEICGNAIDDNCDGVTDPSLTGVTISISETSGGTANDGSICAGDNAILAATGATTYLWNTGATTASITVNPTTATTYTVTATGTGGCTVTANSTVSMAPVANILGTLTQPTICTASDGAINISATGAVGPYTYNWFSANGSGVVSNQEDQSGLTVGDYSVTVTAGNGCTSTAIFSLVGPGGCSICPSMGALTTTPTGAVCAGSTFTLTQSGLLNMGVTYGVQFKYSLTPLTDAYTGGTVLATVPNSGLTSSGTIATTNAVLSTAGTYYI